MTQLDMDAPPPLQSAIPPAQPLTGLAVASLVIGILAVFSSILLVGAFAGLLGILLGAIHIAKRRGPNGMAWAGIALSLLSIVLSVGLGSLYMKGFHAAKAGWIEAANGTGTTADDSTMQFADWIGEELPEFTITSLDGEEFNSRNLRGRPVVLDFWATWCPPCRREIPHFVQLSEENPRDELLIIGISSEDRKTLTEFITQKAVNYPIVSTDDLPPPFDEIIALPTTFFIDRNGVIRNVLVGYHDYDHLKELALAGEQVEEMNETAADQP